MVKYMLPENLPFRALLLRSSRLFTEKINALLQPFNLNYSLWMVLYVIKHAESCSQIEIAQQLKISQPAITKRIATLEHEGFIEIIPTPNKREKIVSLSEKGLSIFSIGEREIQLLEARYSQGLSAEQIEQTKQVLQLFLNQLQQGE